MSQTDSLSVPEMAQMLGIKQEVAYWLVRHDFIRSAKAGRFASARVRRKDIEAFHAQHVFGRDLAALLGISPKTTVLLMAEQGIHPLTVEGGEACRQAVYRLDRPLGEFLAETGRVSPNTGFESQDGSAEEFCLRSPLVR